MGKKKIVFLYILSGIVPTFLLGLMVFLFIILMAQFLKISEIILAHDVSIMNVGRILLNMSISFFPIIFPTSLLFAVVLTYARLSADSEMVALKSLGYSFFYITLPAVVFSLFIGAVSAQTLFVISPVSRLNLDNLMTTIGNQKIISAIAPKTFSDNFFGLTLYANEVDEQTSTLNNVFVHDARSSTSPIVIVAKTGKIQASSDLENQSAQITLFDGSMYTSSGASTANLKFTTYNLNVLSPISKSGDQRGVDTYTLNELQNNRKSPLPSFNAGLLREFATEYHRRISTAVSCLIFGFLGAVLGAGVDRRSGSSIGFILSIFAVAIYWLLYSMAISYSNKSMNLEPALVMWVPNLVFAIFTAWRWRALLRAG